MSATLGQKLREAREARNLKITDVADQLRFSNPKIIEAIESDHYPQQPIDVYWRGYVMNVARLLEMPLQEVEQALEGLGYKKMQPVSLVAKLEAPESPWIQLVKRYWFKSVSFSVVTLLIAMMFVWHFLHRELDLTSANSDTMNSSSITSAVAANNANLNVSAQTSGGSGTKMNDPTATADSSLMVIKNHYALPQQDQEEQQEQENQNP